MNEETWPPPPKVTCRVKRVRWYRLLASWHVDLAYYHDGDEASGAGLPLRHLEWDHPCHADAYEMVASCKRLGLTEAVDGPIREVQ